MNYLNIVTVGSGSGLGSKSVSSSYLGGSTLRQDKSFEELRFEHMQESPTGCPLTLEKVENGSLPVRLLWILGRILDCEAIRMTVVELVSSHVNLISVLYFGFFKANITSTR